MKILHWIACGFLAVQLCSCSIPRTRETDKLGWTDPAPKRDPSFTNHAPIPGRVPYQPGLQPPTQPDTSQGEMKSVKSNPNNFPARPLGS